MSNLGFKPHYERQNYLSFIDEKLAKNPEVIMENQINFFWNQIIEGRHYNFHFFTRQDSMELKEHLPDIYFSKNEILRQLNRLISSDKWNELYTFIGLLVEYFGIDGININEATIEELTFFQSYMNHRPYESLDEINLDDRPGFYAREDIIMRFVHINRNELIHNDSSSLWPREKFLLDSKNCELVTFAFEKGFLSPNRTELYLSHVMDFKPEVYSRLVPLLFTYEARYKGGIA